MNWKFWKKDEGLGNYRIPSGESSLGLQRDSTGLDLTNGYEPQGNATSFTTPTPFTAPTAPTPPSFGQNEAAAYNPGSFNQLPPAPSSFTTANVYHPHDDDEAPTGQQAPSHNSKDLEVVSAKLDAIKSQLDMLNLRLSTMEQRMGQQDQGGPRNKPWY